MDIREDKTILKCNSFEPSVAMGSSSPACNCTLPCKDPTCVCPHCREFSDFISTHYVEREKIEGCENCKLYPHKLVEVTDMKDPHCAKCGRKLSKEINK